MNGPSLEKRLQLYEIMVRIRLFEKKAVELQEEGLTPGRMHPYTGQEAVAVGVCTALEQGDLIVSTHRNGGHLIAMGADPRRMFAEYMGRATGYSQGRGGPMHFSIPELGVLFTTGIVGNGIPVAAGAALAELYQNSDRVLCCFFGDGAANTGSFHEGLNLSALWKLPVVFVCENNRYAETMPFDRAFPIEQIATRASSYGMPGETIDGNDLVGVYESARRALARARSGDGPTLIEAQTYRIGPHFSGESSHYRDEEEIKQWQERDPISRFKRTLLENEIDIRELEVIEERVRMEIDQAAAQAREDPAPTGESLLSGVIVKNSTEATS